VNIDILSLAKRQKNERAIDVALPVLAIECEATPPLDNYLDAYEETVLKLVDIGLSTRGIASTLNATESLVEQILESLDLKCYVEKKPGEPWKITEDGSKYLDGSIEERESENAKFGYMFVNAIKKDVLPYFYEGDINQAPLFNGGQLPIKLTVEGSEEKTFTVYKPKKSTLRKAFKKYYKNSGTAKQLADGDITFESAVDLFEELDAFDEVDGTEETAEPEISNGKAGLSKNMFVRALNCPPKYVYLTMRIILDPSYPGGYRAESPFDLSGIDSSYYLRQIQWLAASGNAYIGDEDLDSFLTREIRHLAPNFKTADTDFSVFVLEKMPLLKLYRDRFSRVYDDMARTYALMQRQNSMLEKENIVSNISRYVLESLFNEFFRSVKNDTLTNVSKTAIDDLKWYKSKSFKEMVIKNTALDQWQIYWNDEYIESVLWRLKRTRGNSIVEKFINVIVLNYYIGTPETKAFLSSKDAQKMYDLTDKLNKVRRKVSHDTDDPFEAKDYDFFMANVFTLINGLLEAYKEV